jgi:hypothetical protein
MKAELDDALHRLCEQFPDVPADAVAFVLGDSYQAVVEASGEPLVGKGEDLARLRLEVRTGHAAMNLSVAPAVEGSRDERTG